MILNLFSIFESQTIYILSNWVSILLVLIFLPQIYWYNISRLIFLVNFINLKLWNEFKIIIKNKFNLNNIIYLISLFIFIIINNFIGLFPYIFTASRHLVFSIRFSLSIWFRVILFGWLKNTKFIFAHLVPQGTPFILIFFMVLIELLRNLIRPLTLSVRLSANIIAGHLLLTLLGNSIPINFFLYLIVLICQLILLILEISVSFIQSYVFVILIILYLKETN